MKLRLGRVTGGGQKGVDGLIILDLITLARNRAADVALLMSGDEDLRETVLHAQSYGLTVVVAGFPRTPRQGQSALLLREADHTLHLTAADLEPVLSVAQSETPQATTSVDTDTGPSISVPPAAETDQQLDDICRSVIKDDRFGAKGPTESRGGQLRLTSRADRVLVARLAEATGTFPVEGDLLRLARERCLALLSE